MPSVLTEWDGSSAPPHVHALQGLGAETFFGPEKGVFFVKRTAGFIKSMTCGLGRLGVL